MIDDRSGIRPLVLSTVFSATLFLSSFLLFSVQPMVARQLLPQVGGSSSLWTTTMLFFQTVLLLGYVTAHFSTRRLRTKQPRFQAAVVAVPLLVLPVALPTDWALPLDVPPSIWVLGVLALIVGLPFFALSTISPTLQSWFSQTSHPRANDPYFLYAAGNAGSVLALIAYPTIIERSLGLEAQAQWWAAGYLLFGAAVLFTAFLSRDRPTARVEPEQVAIAATRVSWRRRGRWLLLSATPSLLLLAVTSHITTDLASFPLLWVLPLLLYMTTHIIAFAKDSPNRDRVLSQVVWLGAIPLAVTGVLQLRLGVLSIFVPLMWFFAAALLCHGRLAADRPSTNQLTEFYVALSLGGALGGLFAAVIAPLAFDAVFEYPIGIALAIGIAKAPHIGVGGHRLRQLGVVGMTLTAVLALLGPSSLTVPAMLFTAGFAFLAAGPVGTTMVLIAMFASGSAVFVDGSQLLRDRSFFGVTAVVEREGQRFLNSGTTVHGSQWISQGTSPEPTTYYHRTGPVGQVFESHSHNRVGIVGLGTGAITSYAEPGDVFEVFEIDPVIVELATDPRWFNYITSSAGEVQVIVGDGRQNLKRSDGNFDILVIDAFSSDAIPTHLLTVEAAQLYLDRLAPGGVVLIHVSNRHFDLVPVLGRIGAELGVDARVARSAPDALALEEGATSSIWVALSDGSADEWSANFVDVEASGPLWTDDHADLLAALALWD